ncbi:MAG: bifunctional diaminohydroxyphosphoribosylaminopyrimidine deaminase/5-amino-6-(5-phosphoribosylamino)uracil reductase RibD [Flavobacteriales bacterium]|nr:bifunctional diaminohydroxyphosphoribosylaminopyrimidine deaminase/5-amino-6-(5-phosphoribosylamino)uracil reductase RibD [Flavobacteriales bacterium]
MAKNDSYYMQLCLDLAMEGMGHVSPNPLVGCVIVRGDEVIGRGFHAQYGEAHAEVNAVASLHPEQELNNSALYVNLEPCSHHGKTPPCADLIINTGISKVVYGMEDPNPLVAGKGLQKLRDAGIEVVGPVLPSECAMLNRRFIVNQQNQRPYIILKWAQSADGYVDPPRTQSDQGIQWITGDESQILTHHWRSEEDAILVGRKTVEVDNPLLTARRSEGTNPVRVVIDPTQQLNRIQYNVFNEEASTIVLAREGAADADVFVEAEGADWLLRQMQNLYKAGIGSILVEGGAATLHSFIEANLWDEARVLTGNVTFAGGIKAPVLSAQPVEEFQSGDDQIRVYSNL